MKLPTENLSPNQLKWLRHYHRLMIKNATTKAQKTITHRHHIIPEAFFINRTRNKNNPGFLEGNPNCKSNFVNLPIREHFIAHLLLLKIYPNMQSVVYAAHLMRTTIINSGRKYEWVKRQYSEFLKKDEYTKETRKRIGDAQRGDKNVSKRKDVREKISKSLTGKKASAEHIEKNHAFRKGKNKSNYAPIAQMAKTMSAIMTGRTKENSEMRKNHAKSLAASMTGKTKETDARLAAASVSLSETMSVLKKQDCLEIVKLVEDGKTLKEIFLLYKTQNAKVTRLKQITKAYEKGLSFRSI